MNKATYLILIVEDNEDNWILAQKILNYYGYQTTIATQGFEALQCCEKFLPDLILIDLTLPDIDGIEVAKQLRKKFDGKIIPIIALTAYSEVDIQEKIRKAGINDYLIKPYFHEELISMVKKYINGFT